MYLRKIKHEVISVSNDKTRNSRKKSDEGKTPPARRKANKNNNSKDK